VAGQAYILTQGLYGPSFQSPAVIYINGADFFPSRAKNKLKKKHFLQTLAVIPPPSKKKGHFGQQCIF
jgi:hypothetical protein